MFRIVRTDTLRQVSSQAVELHDRAETQRLRAERAEQALEAEAAIRVKTATEQHQNHIHELTQALGRAEGALEVLRAQHLLDTEDRAALRMLLRAARRQARPADRVYALFRLGKLHSLHATPGAAEATAEAAGADRAGWTAPEPGAALPPASGVPWRVQALPLHT